MESQTLQRAETATVAGTIWRIDPIHSTIGFSIKHMVFATVDGRFGSLQGTIRFNEDRPNDTSVEVLIDASTIDTGEIKRDEHLRSANFFDVAAYPAIAFRSTRVEPIGPLRRDRWLVVGDLTLHGVTQLVDLAVEQTGDRLNPWNAEVISFAATTKISRKDFGLGYTMPLNGGGPVIGDDVTIAIDVQASKSPIGGR